MCSHIQVSDEASVRAAAARLAGSPPLVTTPFVRACVRARTHTRTHRQSQCISDRRVLSNLSTLPGQPPPKKQTHIIHNAGIYGPEGSLVAVTKADMMNVFETNAVGPLLVAQQFVPLLKTPSRSKDAGFPFLFPPLTSS